MKNDFLFFSFLLFKNKSVALICIFGKDMWPVPFSKGGDYVALFQCYLLPGFLDLQGLMV